MGTSSGRHVLRTGSRCRRNSFHIKLICGAFFSKLRARGLAGSCRRWPQRRPGWGRPSPILGAPFLCLPTNGVVLLAADPFLGRHTPAISVRTRSTRTSRRRFRCCRRPRIGRRRHRRIRGAGFWATILVLVAHRLREHRRRRPCRSTPRRRWRSRRCCPILCRPDKHVYVVQLWLVDGQLLVVDDRQGSLEGVSNPIFDIRYTGWGGGVVGWWGSRVVG